MGSDDRTRELQSHLHELAEGLQAAIYFMEILRSGGHGADATLMDKTAAQLRRAQESFAHVRNHLEDS
jgi:hypothetical protein